MNLLISLTPSLIGILVVLQAGLNRKISAQWGLTSALLLNAAVLFVLAAVVFSLSVWKSDLFPANMKPTLDMKTFSWWFLIPGALGCVLVFGGPWAIARWGAVHTFILIISAQLLASLLWDMHVEGVAVSSTRIAGIVIAWCGALLACKS